MMHGQKNISIIHHFQISRVSLILLIFTFKIFSMQDLRFLQDAAAVPVPSKHCELPTQWHITSPKTWIFITDMPHSAPLCH